MTIAVGDTLPMSPIHLMRDGEVADTTLHEWAVGRRVVLIVVPGAFTPTCSARHLPGYVDHADDFKAKGVEALGCLAVNDVFVMTAWGEARGASGKIDMLADASGATARAMGIASVNIPVLGNTRANRLSLVAEDAVISHLYIEQPAAFEVSAADYLLARI